MSDFVASNGKMFTRQLFWEEWVDLPIEQRTTDPAFTLYRDKPGLINFGKKYVELRDPTGYAVSQELLGDYSHWQTLMRCKWFLAAKESWDRELDAALASEAMAKIRTLLADGLPAQQLAAAKYLANREYRKDKAATKGRPSNDQIVKEAARQAEYNRELEEDAKRIRLVKG